MALVNIWDVYQYNYVRVNKDQSGRTFTNEEFNLAAMIANLEYFKLKSGLPENYQVGVPLAPQMWQVSQNITDAARHLLTWKGGPDSALMTLDQYGVANVPDNYVGFSSCYYEEQVECDTMKPRPIEFVADAAWADRVSNVLTGPTHKDPIAKWFGTKIQFLPKDMAFVHFTYLRMPATPVLAVTIDSNADYVYDPANSTQFDWPQLCLPDIANLIFDIQAGNIQSPFFTQLAEMRKTRGI